MEREFIENGEPSYAVCINQESLRSDSIFLDPVIKELN
jgi:hypothetical protein